MAEVELRVAFVDERCHALAPMAALLAEDVGDSPVAASHGGTDPGGRILPGALTALREVGLDTATLTPRPVSRAKLEDAHAVVTIGPGVAQEAIVSELDAQHWAVPDPEGGQLAAFRQARDELALRVRELLREEGVGLDEDVGFEET